MMPMRWIACVPILFATGGNAIAQAALSPGQSRDRPTEGSTPGVAVPRAMSPPGSITLRHKSPGGSVCLRVMGFAQPFSTNPNLFNHWITAENSCGNSIRFQVCYYGTRDCINMIVSGRERKDAILGTVPSIKDFRYEYVEKF